jgi:phosphate transport system substrate-binding protein
MKLLLQLAGWSILTFATGLTLAQDMESLPAYQPRETVSGVVRVWGNPQMQELVRRWGAGFQQRHPQASVVANLQGSDVAFAGLYTKSADVALLGRDPTASEIQAFEWIYRYRPARVEIMTGSLGQPEKSAALLMFVHKDNPLSALSLAQVDAIFSHEHLRGSEPITTWGQLGLDGKWKHRRIRLYGYNAYSGTGRYFRHAVLDDSRNLNWDRLQEFGDGPERKGKRIDAARRIHDALAKDPYGMAVAILTPGAAASKPLALAAAPDGPFVDATAESLISRRYPLARSVIALVNRAPGKAIEPQVAEFLRYVLSREGQMEVAGDGGFLPLAADNASLQLKQLE